MTLCNNRAILLMKGFQSDVYFQNGDRKMVKKRIFRAILILLAVILISLAAFIGFIFYKASQTEVKMVGKTHIEFFVPLGKTVDHTAFLYPKREELTHPLMQITKENRRKIAAYMFSNHLKLKRGYHLFNRGVDATVEEYITDNFAFEKTPWLLWANKLLCSKTETVCLCVRYS